MSSHDGPPDRPAAPAGLADSATARLAGLEASFDAVERALAQLEDRPPPTCGRCGAVLLDVLLGQRRPGGGTAGAPAGDDLACAPACAT